MADITPSEAIERVNKLLLQLQPTLESAFKFHQVRREKVVHDEQTFAAAHANKGEKNHDVRAKLSAKNKKVIDELQNRTQELRKLLVRTPSDVNTTDVVAVLNDAITNGNWKTGLFFRVIGQRLTALRSELAASSEGEVAEEPSAAGVVTPSVEMRSIFIVLYQAQGTDFARWLKLLSTIDAASIGRPIYHTETDVKAFFRSKGESSSDAYVEVKVSPDDILTDDPKNPSQDRAGRALYTIKRGAIKVENIVAMHHQGNAYKYSEKELLKIENG